LAPPPPPPSSLRGDLALLRVYLADGGVAELGRRVLGRISRRLGESRRRQPGS
ncbi:MAG: hypothetical protein JWN88_3077, partial [Frankiales bacterium]|nr:hypothetical protein [Frankiales bacterium]